MCKRKFNRQKMNFPHFPSSPREMPSPKQTRMGKVGNHWWLFLLCLDRHQNSLSSLTLKSVADIEIQSCLLTSVYHSRSKLKQRTHLSGSGNPSRPRCLSY